MSDLTRTIRARNLSDGIKMNDFSPDKKSLLNSWKEWRMRLRGVSECSHVTFEPKEVACPMN